MTGLTAAGLNAFVQLAAPIVRIVEGKGTIDDDITAANLVADAIAALDPAAAPAVALLEAAEPFAEGLFDLYRAGRITGGYPDIGAEENATNFRDR